MEVTFSKTSWHGKFYYFIYKDNPSQQINLCPYFWKIATGILTLPLIWIGCIIQNRTLAKNSWFENFFLTILSYSLIIFFLAIGETFLPGWPWWVQILNSMGRCFIGFIIILATLATLDSLKAFYVFKTTKAKAQTRQDSLFFSKIKAWKNKICPQINWV